MDLKIHRPHGACSVTGRPFAPGETFYSALVRGSAGLERIDWSVTAWPGPSADAVCWWRSAYPAAEAAGRALAPVDVLLDVLEDLDDRPEEAALRYLLALQLVRRRVLRIVDTPGTPPSAAALVLSCRKRDREYRVAVPAAAAATGPEVAQRLTALVWSGDAA